MKVEDAATANTGVWITFIAVVLLYVALGVTTILVLRAMSRRFRRGGGFVDHDVPLRAAPATSGEPRAVERGADEHRRSRSCCCSPSRRTPCSAARTSAPASGTSTAGGPERGAAPRELIEHSIGPVWEANHVWLIFIFVVTWTAFPTAYASIMADDVRPAHHRRARHRPARGELRVPQVGE